MRNRSWVCFKKEKQRDSGFHLLLQHLDKYKYPPFLSELLTLTINLIFNHESDGMSQWQLFTIHDTFVLLQSSLKRQQMDSLCLILGWKPVHVVSQR